MPDSPTQVRSRRTKPGAYFGVPLAVWVIVFLVGGLAVGMLWPHNPVAAALYTSGTYFPRAVVTFATLVIFALLSGATAKLVLYHRQRAGQLFGLILAVYVALGIASLAFVTFWIPILTHLPLTAPGAQVLGFGQWLHQMGRTFATLFSDQPLIQVLFGAVVAGYLSAIIPAFQSVAQGMILGSQATLWLFKKLLWYYPFMIGCLAIGIPLKFGAKGMAVYGQTTAWVAVVTIGWSVVLFAVVKLTTKRSFKQLFSYYANVWPTGFGTGGSYETLAMNVVSAESDLGLPREIAEVSIVFGTVLNKSCASMCVLLVTITVARLMQVPISLAEILLLVPPVLILGLESPGIPGGAAFFMSPIIAVLLHVREPAVFVATFVTMYSGLIPMFSTAGNTTNDGLMGAVLNDWFARRMKLMETTAEIGPAIPSPEERGEPGTPQKLAGWILLALGTWMVVSPQAALGLKALKWMHNYAFGGEAVVGVFVVAASLLLLSPKAAPESPRQLRRESVAKPQPS